MNINEKLHIQRNRKNFILHKTENLYIGQNRKEHVDQIEKLHKTEKKLIIEQKRKVTY